MRIKRESLLVAFILVFGFVLRLIGIRHGLPGIYHPDEPIVVSRAVSVVLNGDYNPHFFHWPSLLMYLLAIEYEIIYLLGKIAGTFNNGEDYFKYYSTHRGEFHYWGRLLVAAMSTGIGYFFYLTVKNWLDNKSALFVLCLASITPLLIKHGQYITPDIPALFFASVSIYFLSIYHFKDKKASFIYWAAVMAGLATATKYNYALMIIPLLIIYFADTLPKEKFKLKSLIYIFTSFLVSFFVFNPFIIIDFSQFVFQFKEISFHLGEGHIGMEAGRHPSVELIRHLINGTGWMFFIAGIIGLLISFRNNKIWTIALITFPLLILILHGQWPVTADRYAIPLLIFALLFSTVFIRYFFSRSLYHRSFGIVVLAVLLIQPIISCAKIYSESLKPDTREVARAWINRNIPRGSKLAIEKDGPYLKQQHIQSAYFNEPAYLFFIITPWYGTSFRTKDSPLDLIVKNKPEYVIINSGVYSRYQPGSPSQTSFPDIYKVWRNYYDSLESIGELVHEVEPSEKYVGPTVRIYRIPESVYDEVTIVHP
ncbi:glycosyltransferase family 39 protein [bacterium]|nr:glycosyltransferase family 39 protein [bacterium]